MTKSDPTEKKTPSWFSWFSQLTKSNSKSNMLSWKKPTLSDHRQPVVAAQPIQIKRPSITISTPSRRDSEQSHGSILTDDQYSTKAASYYQRRDSSERSMLSELWSKAKRHHPHYPQYQHIPKKQSLNQLDYRYYSTMPRNHQLKRHSISSSFFTNSVDNTPSQSRPNSVIYTPSQPTSPNFLQLIKNYSSDDIEHFVLDDLVWIKYRWSIKHELTKLAIDGLFSIPDRVTFPLSIERHVLQIGCGDAAWAMDVALEYSRWMIVGLDNRTETHYEDEDYEFPILSTAATAMITRKSMIPKNFKLIHCHSLLQGLRHLPDNTFDLVESRFLVLSYTFEEYQQLMNECIRVCKPNGYIELMEVDLRIYHQRLLSCPVTHGLNNEVVQVCEAKKLDPRLARRLMDLVDPSMHAMAEARYISLPIGVWGGRLGVLFRDDIHHLIESFQEEACLLQDMPCRTEDELEDKLELMDKEMEANRSFMNLHLLNICKKHL